MKNFFKKSSYSFKELLDIYMKKIKEIPWILGRHAFLCILLFILIDILIGGFLFYKYVLLIEAKEVENVFVPNKFQENIYRFVIEEQQKRNSILENFPLLDKNYTDPFK
ncbi:MAG: hypothetical protein HY219_01165 [Candidatus Staskawiczbacteria bacterium]|nr:hypothetical protein [Candidatus Staskawiczbacteria bacterium]